MSDADQDRIARLLRDQGQADAPSGLAEDVMAQVRLEPQVDRRRSGRVWRPVAAVAAAAAVLLAIGFGIASLADNSGSSSSAGAASSAGAGGGVENAPAAADQGGSAITVERSDAKQILGYEAFRKAAAGAITLGEGATTGGSSRGHDVIELSPSQLRTFRGALLAAAARTPHPEHPVVIRVRRN